jgi:hypothetical protein
MEINALTLSIGAIRVRTGLGCLYVLSLYANNEMDCRYEPITVLSMIFENAKARGMQVYLLGYSTVECGG